VATQAIPGTLPLESSPMAFWPRIAREADSCRTRGLVAALPGLELIRLRSTSGGSSSRFDLEGDFDRWHKATVRERTNALLRSSVAWLPWLALARGTAVGLRIVRTLSCHIRRRLPTMRVLREKCKRFVEINLFGSMWRHAVMMVTAWLIMMPLIRVPGRFGLLRNVWHPAMVEFAGLHNLALLHRSPVLRTGAGDVHCDSKRPLESWQGLLATSRPRRRATWDKGGARSASRRSDQRDGVLAALLGWAEWQTKCRAWEGTARCAPSRHTGAGGRRDGSRVPVADNQFVLHKRAICDGDRPKDFTLAVRPWRGGGGNSAGDRAERGGRVTASGGQTLSTLPLGGDEGDLRQQGVAGQGGR